MHSKNDTCTEGRSALAAWQQEIKANCYQQDADFRHSVAYHLPDHANKLDQELTAFTQTIISQVEPLVAENNKPQNLPRIEAYDGIGNRIETLMHHPAYAAAGNLIYGSRMLERMAKMGGLTEGLLFFFLSSQAGEAGHNCPIACSYGIIRVLQKFKEIPHRDFYLEKLIVPSYDENYTGAQFVTEVQGGSDAGLNAVKAVQDEHENWHLSGEKWFCSNADAELILVTARCNTEIAGTKGLGLFLVPAELPSGQRNSYTLRRLKDKLGTRSLATAEIDFQGAYAVLIGKPEEGFKILMENVLHASRLFNSVSVVGMARRAFHIAASYARHRCEFGHPIIEFPLVQQNLARIKAENTALLASIFAMVRLQDQHDLNASDNPQEKLLLRLLANLHKYLSALWTVEHIHHSLDVLAGNGTIETFSSIPLLFRDSIICENWEGTHNVLQMQILKDTLRYEADAIFFHYLDGLLQRIPADEPHHQVLIERSHALKTLFEEIKNSSSELQAMLIKPCVDNMGTLLAAVHLQQEACDQEMQGKLSKRHCLDYFIDLHLTAENKRSAVKSLSLLQSVLSG